MRRTEMRRTEMRRRERGERDMARTQCSSRRGDAHKTAAVPLEGAGSSFLFFSVNKVAQDEFKHSLGPSQPFWGLLNPHPQARKKGLCLYVGHEFLHSCSNTQHQAKKELQPRAVFEAAVVRQPRIEAGNHDAFWKLSLRTFANNSNSKPFDLPLLRKIPCMYG